MSKFGKIGRTHWDQHCCALWKKACRAKITVTCCRFHLIQNAICLDSDNFCSCCAIQIAPRSSMIHLLFSKGPINLRQFHREVKSGSFEFRSPEWDPISQGWCRACRWDVGHWPTLTQTHLNSATFPQARHVAVADAVRIHWMRDSFEIHLMADSARCMRDRDWYGSIFFPLLKLVPGI